jgi:hypothetical protein
MIDSLMRRVFRSLDPFDEPFQPGVASRLVLFPTNGYTLEESQFAALARAAQAAGETEGICVMTEFVDFSNPPVQYDHARFSFSSFPSYAGLRVNVAGFNEPTPILLENAIISDRGEWGILFSQESHALLGGRPAFVEAFKSSYSRAESDLEKFIEARKRNAERMGSDISWMPKLLKHLREP